MVKRIWTPSRVLFSVGWCFLFLAAFEAINGALEWKRWAFPLVVVGMSPIAAYCMAHLFEPFISSSFKTRPGPDASQVFGPAYEPLLRGAAVLLMFWLILFWMRRRRIYLRIRPGFRPVL